MLRETDLRIGLLDRLPRCFVDHRQRGSVEHDVRSLVSQRVYGLALGYEDLNDHDELRSDSVLALLVGERDLVGAKRVRARDEGRPLAGASTLNRLELGTPESAGSERYKRIVADGGAMDRLLVDQFLESHETPPKEIWLDLDATDDPLHGHQEGRFFHGYYGHYCYLPLYIFCGEHLLCARLRRSNIDASAGSVEELERIVVQIRERWPKARIVIRGDSGFCREPLMRWCEDEGIGYVLGLARNARVVRALGRKMAEAKQAHRHTGKPARRFLDFMYRTRKTWSRSRRVIGKAEYLPKGPNPRFVVTDPPRRFYGSACVESGYRSPMRIPMLVTSLGSSINCERIRPGSHRHSSGNEIGSVTGSSMDTLASLSPEAVKSRSQHSRSTCSVNRTPRPLATTEKPKKRRIS